MAQPTPNAPTCLARTPPRQATGQKAMMDQFAALQGRVAQLEVKPAGRPQPAPRKPPGRVRDAVAALKREPDQLVERLARVEAYQPVIADKTQAWVAQADRASRTADEGEEREERNWPCRRRVGAS